MPNMQHCCPPMSTVINGTPTKHALGNLSGLSEGPATTHCSRYYNTLSQSRTNPPSPFKCISHMHQRVLPVPTGEFVEASRAQPIHSKTSHKHPLKAQASGETAFGAGGDYFGARRIRRVWQLVRALAFSRGASEVSQEGRRVFWVSSMKKACSLFSSVYWSCWERGSPLQLHTLLVLICKDVFI